MYRLALIHTVKVLYSFFSKLSKFFFNYFYEHVNTDYGVIKRKRELSVSDVTSGDVHPLQNKPSGCRYLMFPMQLGDILCSSCDFFSVDLSDRTRTLVEVRWTEKRVQKRKRNEPLSEEEEESVTKKSHLSS